MKNICVSCGMCCDGTMYRYVAISDGDLLAPLTDAGAALVERDADTTFLQPCPAFRGGCCSIYESRPAVCRKYKCFLLRRYEAGDVSFEEAQKLIDRTIALRDQVRPALTAFAEPQSSEALSGLYRLMSAKLESAPDPLQARREMADLLLSIGALRVILSRDFEPRESEPPAAADLEGKVDRTLGE